jgi:ribosomal protein S18 acetylase RimI-like enzyme
MSPIRQAGQVFDAVQKAKADAPAFCTNFFPVESKLQGWIEHGELSGEVHAGAALFLRKDRDFHHFYFCAADEMALQRAVAAWSGWKSGPMVTDLIGNEYAVNRLSPVLEPAGFRRYTRLQRMARIGRPETGGHAVSADFAGKADGRTVLGLIENLFDRYGEQLPMPYEIGSAIENRQVLAARCDGAMAGLLMFETQGLASAVRFWGVAEKFRARRVGSALMQHYFQTHAVVRRFTLWVNSNNENAISKYRHYGYAPDGLVDQILANDMINL